MDLGKHLRTTNKKFSSFTFRMPRELFVRMQKQGYRISWAGVLREAAEKALEELEKMDK